MALLTTQMRHQSPWSMSSCVFLGGGGFDVFSCFVFVFDAVSILSHLNQRQSVQQKSSWSSHTCLYVCYVCVCALVHYQSTATLTTTNRCGITPACFKNRITNTNTNAKINTNTRANTNTRIKRRPTSIGAAQHQEPPCCTRLRRHLTRSVEVSLLIKRRHRPCDPTSRGIGEKLSDFTCSAARPGVG